MEIEDEIQLTDVSEVFIEDLYKGVNHLEDDQFIFVLINNGDKIQWSISFIYDFVLFVLKKVAHLWFTGDY